MGSFREDHMTEVKFKPNVCILLYSAWFSNSVVSNGNCLSLQNPLDCGDGVLLVCSFSTWLCQRIQCGENLCTACGLPFAARKLDYASHSYFVISSFPAMWCWMPWKRLYSVMNAKAVWRNMGGMHESVLYLVWITDRCTVMQVGMPNLLPHVAALVSVHVLQWHRPHATPVMHGVHTSAHTQKPYCYSERAAFTWPLKHAPT